MFNGIVETTGTINQLASVNDCLSITISPNKLFDDLSIGDSMCVNGVCLTITSFDDKAFNVTVVPETMRVTNLGDIAVGESVNLERSLRANDRISGHYVQGHVDNTGEIIDLQKDGNDAYILKISMPTALEKYIVKKGYIALDGMSITVIDTTKDWFTITLIPHTRQVCIANQYCIGKKINIEVDILGKYVEKMLRR